MMQPLEANTNSRMMQPLVISWLGMLGNRYEGEICSAARCLEAVGERWSLLIIRDALFVGVTHFNDFARRLGVARNILSARLDSFVETGIMERTNSDGSVYEHYVLTDKGRDLAPVIVALTKWGDRWHAPNGPPIIYCHTSCGGDVEQYMHCTSCKSHVEPDELGARHGSGFPTTA